MALRNPYEYVTKGYPSLARADFLLVVIWLLIDTLYNVLLLCSCLRGHNYKVKESWGFTASG